MAAFLWRPFSRIFGVASLFLPPRSSLAMSPFNALDEYQIHEAEEDGNLRGSQHDFAPRVTEADRPRHAFPMHRTPTPQAPDDGEREESLTPNAARTVKVLSVPKKQDSGHASIPSSRGPVLLQRPASPGDDAMEFQFAPAAKQVFDYKGRRKGPTASTSTQPVEKEAETEKVHEPQFDPSSRQTLDLKEEHKDLAKSTSTQPSTKKLEAERPPPINAAKHGITLHR